MFAERFVGTLRVSVWTGCRSLVAAISSKCSPYAAQYCAHQELME